MKPIPGLDESAEKYSPHNVSISSVAMQRGFRAGAQWCERERVSVAVEALKQIEVGTRIGVDLPAPIGPLDVHELATRSLAKLEG